MPARWKGLGLASVAAAMVASLTALSGCGNGGLDQRWIFEDAAVVRCTVAGRTNRTPEAWSVVPVPMPPTGLFARQMDPSALDDLGFERDAMVCAALDAPDSAALQASDESLSALLSARSSADRKLRDLGICGCYEARRARLDGYFASCQLRRRRQSKCKPDQAKRAQVEALAGEVAAAVDDVALVKRHWRLFGRTDRPDRFAVRFADIVGKYEGGSELFVPGMTPGGGRSDELVAALLGQPNVKAVVRQDAGLAVLVVRAVGNQLVLDHFSHIDIGERYARLVSELDAANIEAHVAALALDGSRSPLQFDPRRQPVMAVDRVALSRVDEAEVVGSRLSDLRYDPALEQRTSPPVFVDRVEFALGPAPEGEGAMGTIEGWGRLTEAGVGALDAVADTQLSVMFDELPFDPTPPSFEPAPQPESTDMRFVGRGQPAQAALLDGIHGLFDVLKAVERAQPGALEGTLDSFSITFPTGPLPGGLETRPGLEALRERLSKRPQRLQATRDGDTYRFTLSPVQ